MRKPVAALLIALCLSPLAQTFAQEPTASPALPGRIAYIGADFNVYTLAGPDQTRTQLTEDAGRSDDSLLAYQWPTWSTDGRLAYFGLTIDGGSRVPATSVYVSGDGISAGDLVYDSETQVYNYAYWSPQNCPDGADCRDLAVLLSDPDADGLLVERIRVHGEVSSTTLGVGAPFYFSWSPDGTRMLWQRNNRQFDIYDVSAGDVAQTLDAQPGFISAPAWSPVDDRLLVGAQSSDGGSTDLTIIANETSEALASGLSGLVSYAWSPDGNQIAYTAEQGPLMVVDAVTGEIVARSPVSGVYAFFWSPDSARIAYVTLAVQPGSFSAGTGAHMAVLTQGNSGLAWSVLDVQTEANRRLATFLPTQDMLYLLSYFDQFSQSHRIWSPDSQNIVYGELAAAAQPVVTVLNVTGQDVVPLTIAEGQIGVWSFE